MAVHTGTVKWPHPLCKGSQRMPDCLPACVRKFWRHLGKAEHAVVAFEILKGSSVPHIVGFVRYSGGHALGTWVHPRLRGSGLAMRLWDHLLRTSKPRHMYVGTVSAAGRAFALKLVERYPAIVWELETL